KGLKAPEPEPVGLKSYMLVRVALDVGEDTWFGERLGMPEEEDCGSTAQVFPDLSTEVQAGCWDKQKSRPGSRMRKVRPGDREKQENRLRSWMRKVRPDDRNRRIDGPKSRERGIWKVWGRLWGLERREAGPVGEMPVSGRGERQGRRFWRRRRERLKEKAEAARRKALLAQREERIRRTEASIKRLALEVAELAGEGNLCYCAYDNRVRKALLENCRHGSILPVLWQRCFEWREFADYTGRFWVEQLMQEAVLPHFVILGTADCIPELLEKYARGMKSLRWILAEADCTPELEGFVEDFYIEFGLAASLQVLPGPKEFKRLQLACALPSNILDFTGEPGIGICGVAKGSIWLDMWSVEEKRRRILGRGPGISYFSIKEKWKYAQRRCKSPVLP
ncbi:MAG TPA: hypothetical protein DCZ91_06680, partial [Lachnospiraceae bacterium]|nr:hypothetical protein [Lachnospiraceae bacterium]